VFSHKLSENTELRLLEERHAQELSDLTDRNREHLRAWLKKSLTPVCRRVGKFEA
jgi:ribosomal-protein-serine acetyltransferase